ncbi:MAG: sigma-70 family RNA polymerase sigma factor [Pirellulaceae bacterium]
MERIVEKIHVQGSEKPTLEPDTDHKKEFVKSVTITDRSDSWLLRSWKNGDERAAEVLFNRYAIRLVALVASRLNQRYRSQVDPEEVVQSAMGSFFDAAKHSRIQVSQSVSLWRLLATFARRKLSRSIERHSASKRGGDHKRVSLDLAATQTDIVTVDEADAAEFVNHLKSDLPPDQFAVVEGLLAGLSQREIADSLGIDERTVRRRISKVREMLRGNVDEGTEPDAGSPANQGLIASSTAGLPRVNYNAFVLGNLIGSGGFGKVYRASMQSDGSTIAVKFLRKVFWQNEAARESFRREINAASGVNHPGIIRYLGFGESPHGGPYVLSEWIDGQPMHAIDRPRESVFIEWLLQICVALQAVHNVGLVHGDLTPANILIDDRDRITITDFGFSRSSNDPASPILGATLGFAAPEQIDPAFGDISPRTDIYAVGGLIHWYLFGKPPNHGDGVAEALKETITNSKQHVRRCTTSDSGLAITMSRSLQPYPDHRSITLDEIIHLISPEPFASAHDQ